jgi:hypothetical protein
LLLFGFCQRVTGVHVGAETDTIELLQFFNACFGKALALQTEGVNSINLRLIAITDSFYEGQGISRNHRKAADKSMGADAAKLVDGGNCADRCMIKNGNMSGQSGCIGHDDVASNDAIMRHMTVSHYEIVVPNYAASSSAFCAAIQADKFTKYVVVSNLQIGCFSLILQVLRICPDRTMMVKVAPFADRCPALNAGMRIQDAAGSYGSVGPDDTVGPDMSFGRNFTGTVYYCSRMNGHFIWKKARSLRGRTIKGKSACSIESGTIYNGTGQFRFDCHIAVDQCLTFHFVVSVTLFQDVYFDSKLVARNNRLTKAALVDA